MFFVGGNRFRRFILVLNYGKSGLCMRNYNCKEMFKLYISLYEMVNNFIWYLYFEEYYRIFTEVIWFKYFEDRNKVIL